MKGLGSFFNQLRLVILALFWASGLLIADDESSLRFELRGEVTSLAADTLDQGIFYRKNYLPNLDAEFGARLAESVIAVRSLEYKGEVGYTLFGFFQPSVRLSVSNYLPEGMGSTTLQLRGNLFVEPFSGFELFFSGGWYERFINLNGIAIYPHVTRDLVDHDWVVRMGTRVEFLREWHATAELSTYDSIDTFNLNNPFVGLSTDWAPVAERWKASLFARYRVLLGFGRLDAFLVGVGLEYPL